MTVNLTALPPLRPAVLLDRDGTVIVESSYLSDPDKVVLETGTVQGLRRLQGSGFALVVVSNQSGVGRGYFGRETVARVNARVAELLAAEGIAIDGWYFCPHAPLDDCDCRKPASGMALRAAADHGLDLTASYVVGDRQSDVEMGLAMGGRGMLVLTGHGAGDRRWAEGVGVPVAADLDTAAEMITAGAVPRIATRVDDLRRAARGWLRGAALPLWASRGYDRETGSFEERLAFSGEPDRNAPRRLMVQARQVAVYARAALEGDYPAGADLAREAGANLIARYLRADGAPGWVFSIDRSGRVIDSRRDLYAHAFALFALAWLRRLGPPAGVEAAIAETLDVVDGQFFDPHLGGYWDGLPRTDPLRRQNPHMHLFEALIELATDDADPGIRARCQALDGLARRAFLGAGGTLRETFDDAWQVVPFPGSGSVEPGHQMGWAVLWSRYSALTGEDRRDIIDSLVDRALRTGLGADGRVVDECGEDGMVREASSRSWSHAEAARALALQIAGGRRDLLPTYAAVVARLLHRFCNPALGGGWVDHFDADDGRLSQVMPASSLYHVYFGLKSLDVLD